MSVRFIGGRSNSGTGSGVACLGIWTATNCTFSGNSAGNNGGVADGGTWTATNVICWGGGSNKFNNLTNSTIEYSCVENGEWTPSDGFITTVECISANPLFVNPANGDFHLLPTSECVNSGTFEGAPLFDKDGIERPQPPNPGNYLYFDMGIYEQAGAGYPDIRVITPNGGETWYAGITATVEWSISNTVEAGSYEYIWLSTNEGSTWDILITQEPAVLGISTCEWIVNSLLSTECLVKVTAEGWAGESYDTSDATFEIRVAGDLAPPVVTVEAPVTGEPLTGGTQYSISWEASDNILLSPEAFTIWFSSNEGFSWRIVATEIGSIETTCLWNVPNISTEVAMISVEAVDWAGNVGSGISGTFEIILGAGDTTPPLVTVEAPNGGEIFTGGSTYEIRWSATDGSGIKSNGITIIYSMDSGATWYLTQSGLPNTGTYSWEAATVNSYHSRILVFAEDIYGNIGSDISDSDFTLSTEAAAPPIGPIKINGGTLVAGDVISSVAKIQVHLSNNAHGISKVIIIIHSNPQEIILTLEDGTSNEGTWSGNITIPPGSHTLTVYVLDGVGNENIVTVPVVVMSGAPQVMGTPLNYPNPFKPLSSDPNENTTQIQYSLSVDTPVMIIMYDITGHELKRWNFGRGMEGGRAGVNTIRWNGRSMFGEVAGNGMYLYKIISGNKVIGSGRIVVLD